MPPFQRLPMADADVLFFPAFFPQRRSAELFDELLRTTPWKQERIKLYGKSIDVPRLTAWHGDEGKSYRYSGITVEPQPWTPALLTIKEEIEPACGVVFNSVLLNRYRGGGDSVSWHSDDEPELGKDPVIGSVSFGQNRVFQFRHKRDRKQKVKIDLTPGSLLLMRGETQHHWLHQVPKGAGAAGERINLTFRNIH